MIESQCFICGAISHRGKQLIYLVNYKIRQQTERKQQRESSELRFW